LITIDKEKAFKPVIDSNIKWYNTNKDTAKDIDFSQQLLKLEDSITTIFIDAAIVEEIKRLIKSVQNEDTNLLKSRVSSMTVKQQEVEEQQVDVNSGVKIMTSTAIKVFTSLVIVTLCLLSGGFAANFAIGRVPSYRVLYFIYGCIPFFVPFVLGYTIYKRISEGRISFYAFLPISIESATTRLGKLLWYPFYWVPDQHAIDMYKTYIQSLPLQVA
jgi:hypothetical protein